ncbi:FeoA family protein [Dermatophilaceae bacterium Sec6.4]
MIRTSTPAKDLLVPMTFALAGRTGHRSRAVLHAAAVSVPSASRVPSATTLAQVSPGQSAQVLGYDDTLDPGIARRLCDLGLAPGEAVTVVRRAPLRDPVIFRVAGCEVALRASQASTILVAPIA